MSNIIDKLFSDDKAILADGAIGTNLFLAGLQSGELPEIWNIEKKSQISKLHKSFIDAGSRIILTNSFGANKYRLSLHGYKDKTYELNRLAALIAREEADKVNKKIFVAGSIGPTGEILQPYGSVSIEEAKNAFIEQAIGLIDGGVDVLWAETISSKEEIKAVSEAACQLNFPYCVTVSFDTSGRTMMGLSSEDLTRFIADLPYRPIAFGGNCGTGVGDLMVNIKQIIDLDPSIKIIAKGNAGIPKYKNGDIMYDGTPKLMADYALLAASCGVSIIGGCCGTTASHIKAMHEALENIGKYDYIPDLKEIHKVLGGDWLTKNHEIPDIPQKRVRIKRTERRKNL